MSACRSACIDNKGLETSASWLPGGLSQCQTMSLRLPRVLARLGHPAIWAALAGHTGLAFDLEALLDHVDLCCAVQEVAAPRAEHDVHG